jgi:hypothetical protein
MATLPSTTFNPTKRLAATTSTTKSPQDANEASASEGVEDDLASPPPYPAQEVDTGLQAMSQLDQQSFATAANPYPHSDHNESPGNNVQNDPQSNVQTPSTKEIPPVHLEIQQNSSNPAVSGPTPRPESLIVNGIRYVPEVIPVVVNAPAPSTSEPKLLKRVGNLPTSTAGQLPQSGLGNPHGEFAAAMPESSTAHINASTDTNTLATVTDHQAYIANV